ncbi:MAG: hypothetical protein Q9N68_13755 [Gammaproteobacteria bacterium]|nr:hypothetical protein [Gammaproteobacteria bacterium]
MKLPLLSSFSLTLLLFTPITQANSPCKGLANEACHSDNNCRWIESYTTKKGTSVKAYCRSQAKKRNTTSTLTPTPKEATPNNNESLPPVTAPNEIASPS